MMTKSEFADFMVGATWGAEVDLNNADRKIPLPEGNTWCTEEDWGCTPCGVCVDPTQALNNFGGELQTKPCGSPDELLKLIFDIAELVCPGGDINDFPASLHVHIRVPALLNNPDILKYLLVWGEQWNPQLQEKIYPLMQPDLSLCNGYYQRRHYEIGALTYNAARRAYYDEQAIDRGLTCKGSVEDIVKALHPNWDDMKNKARYAEQFRGPMEGAIIRPAVNYGHLIINGTIEFRAFYPLSSLNKTILKNCIEYPARYLECALTNWDDPMKLVNRFKWHETSTWGTPADPQYMRARRGATDLLSVDIYGQAAAIELLLGTGEITLADLNYPQHWIDEGFS